jgi:hypothetical protein
MSTLLYEAITNVREATKEGEALDVAAVKPSNEEVKKPIPKLVGTVAALVPVEVLAAHAFVLGAVSQSSDPADKGPVQVMITDEGAATGAWACFDRRRHRLLCDSSPRAQGVGRHGLFPYVDPRSCIRGVDHPAESDPVRRGLGLAQFTRALVGVGLALGALLLSRVFAENAETSRQKAPRSPVPSGESI